jgi:DNA-binding response OmpR family regulator
MKKILIVEDDQKIAMALAIRLKANGYSASIAPDALAGASEARAIKPDLILLDISLPGGNGFQLAETFLRMPETSGTPVIFITASKNPELLKKVMELGAVGLFEKPFDAEELHSAIDRKFNSITDLLNAGEHSVATNHLNDEEYPHHRR